MIDRFRGALLRRRHKRSAGAGSPAGDWRVTLKKRIAVAAVTLVLWALGIEMRLVYLQVFDRADLVDRAERQQERTFKPPAKRGDILDRRGRVLATSVDADSVFAVPSAIDDERAMVGKLCGALRDCTPKERQDLIERLQTQRNFTYVRRQVTPDEARRIKDLNLDGIAFQKESRRYYPNKELAAHLLGFVGLDNKGLAGIESAYDAQIRGKEGRVLVQTDARHHIFNRLERPPTVGSTIELTIDEYLQHIAERELHAGVVEHQAAGGSAIIMDPRTGEILAMANEPTFNPNIFREFPETARRNRAVQNLYEPGSTFKVVTAGGAIDEHIMPVDGIVDTGNGLIRIGSRVVNDEHPHASLSFTDVLVMSSNVGAIRIGFKLGADRLSDYVQRFGFGRPVSPDFPSENPGIVWDRAKWTDSALASVSMGYQVGVTPLQMAAAVSSVANGGEYMEPRLVRAAYHDDRRFVVKPKVVRRTISADTAAALTTIMEQVVERGTGKGFAEIPGFTVAGKTGTANTLVNGRYSNQTYASFVGFAPSRDPKVTVIVMLEAPHGKTSHFGGPVSGPIFRRITEAALRYLGVPPSLDPSPPVLVTRHPDGGPVPAMAESNKSPVKMVVDGPPGTVPDVRGMSARDAMRKLSRAGLSAKISGDGFVVAQDPEPGGLIDDTGICHITLDRAPVRMTSIATEP